MSVPSYGHTTGRFLGRFAPQDDAVSAMFGFAQPVYFFFPLRPAAGNEHHIPHNFRPSVGPSEHRSASSVCRINPAADRQPVRVPRTEARSRSRFSRASGVPGSASGVRPSTFRAHRFQLLQVRRGLFA